MTIDHPEFHTPPSRRLATQSAAPVRPCPECVAGKHRNCDGTTWDEAADAPTRCPCDAPEHL